MNASLWIGGRAVAAQGEPLISLDPSTGESIWEGSGATPEQVDTAIVAARDAQAPWARRSLDERLAVLREFTRRVDADRESIAELIASEVGKPRWDARSEVAAVVGKLDHSVNAWEDRSGTRLDRGARLVHRPIGVMAVLGPFNFPAHLPNGHIVPALLAGNTVVFKPSELTPAVGERLVRLWHDAGAPDGVVNLLQGGRAAGESLIQGRIDGALFTGSYETGRAIHASLARRPEILLALEMGGNNPLVVHDFDDPRSVTRLVIESAFLTSGQRCTCARRMLLREGAAHDELLDAIVVATDQLIVGGWRDEPEPFMGPVVSDRAAAEIMRAGADLVAREGKCLTSREIAAPVGTGFVAPSVVDVGGVAALPDEEVFGPLLTVQRYRDLDEAIALASDTRYGLAAGIVTRDASAFEHFAGEVRAGIVNWNRPLTGASSAAPFGGVGASGNHRPSAWYAADYCAHPTASLTADRVDGDAALPPGLLL